MGGGSRMDGGCKRLLELVRKCTEGIRVEAEVDWIRTGDRKRKQMERKRMGERQQDGWSM